MPENRQTDKQTYSHADRNTLQYSGGEVMSSRLPNDEKSQSGILGFGEIEIIDWQTHSFEVHVLIF